MKLITPSKYITFEQSIIYKMLFVLDGAENQETIVHLYHRTKGYFDGVNEFILALDTLYALNKIEIDFSKGVVFYAA